MRIIQSFWTHPMNNSEGTTFNNRFHGGWLDMKYHLMSWTYSCLQLRRFYDHVELITDTQGKRLLIDQLSLPYTKTEVVLDDLKNCDPELWAMGKIRAFSLQDLPFIHVDGDVFIWERFPERIEKAQLVAQNIESNFPFYAELLQGLIRSNSYVPDAIRQNYLAGGCINAYNAGIIGGNNISFFKMFVAEALRFVRENLTNKDVIFSGMFNAMYEQHLYYCMARSTGTPVECFTDLPDEHEFNRVLKGVLQFKHAPYTTKYIHLFGEDAKRNRNICYELARKLSESYPDYHARVLRLTREMEQQKHESKLQKF